MVAQRGIDGGATLHSACRGSFGTAPPLHVQNLENGGTTAQKWFMATLPGGAISCYLLFHA